MNDSKVMQGHWLLDILLWFGFRCYGYTGIYSIDGRMICDEYSGKDSKGFGRSNRTYLEQNTKSLPQHKSISSFVIFKNMALI